MNINELDQYRLSDAVKFHNSLNPRLWDETEHLHPRVREKLLEIAADFQEFLGVADLDVKDITISGSNAAYSYTPNSDIDLHLVVAMPQDNSEVYQELFNAKKYQYNDEHDIRIGGADVELYVQPADQPHHSQGIYSIANSKWLQVPSRQQREIDDHCVQHKFLDLQARIEMAVNSGELARMQTLWNKIKTMRKTGLAATGEFGCDNLVFKLLRNSGDLDMLQRAKQKAHDQILSLSEQPQPRTRYGFTAESPDGVSPSTRMFLSETDTEQIIHDFIQNTAKTLGIEKLPRIHIHTDPDWSVEQESFGMYQPESNELHVNVHNRHILDILRTLAHELTHCRQHEINSLGPDAGDTGSRIENQAHAMAGIIMRHYADQHPEVFDDAPLRESSGYIPTAAQASDPRFSMALTQDVRPGETGRQANKLALDTDSQGRPSLLITSANLMESLLQEMDQLGNQTPPGPETPPTMPKGTVRVDVSDVYDWYKLGQHISNLKGLGRHDFGQGPPSTIVSFGDEDTEHKFIQDLQATGLDVTDIDPRDPQQPPGMPKIKTDPTYNVDEQDDLVESLRQEFELLEDQFLGEIKMTTKSLRQEAAGTGAQVGIEFEMIVPDVKGSSEDVEMEPDYDDDRRARSISSIVDYFDDGDYNSRREVRDLEQDLRQDYLEWADEHFEEHWSNNVQSLIQEYLEREVPDDQILDLVGGDPDREVDSDDRERAADLIAADQIEPYYEEARDSAREEWFSDDDHEEAWLGDQGLRWMTDVFQAYSHTIAWPHWRSVEDDDGEGDIASVAQDFEDAIGMPVEWSSSYHGVSRKPGVWVIEPDGSLNAGSSEDAGLEFVSPPMPLDEMIPVMNRVREWARKRGCYTNRSTGLHMNVSVPGFSRDQLDYVKLALLMGDQYVLDQFGRTSNTYAKSALGKVKDIISNNPDRAQDVLEKMRGHMADFASRALHSGSTDKYTSANVHDDYVEFRSPGGDWLDENWSKAENTLLRFVVALNAATKPELYRKEYMSKLRKILNPEGNKDVYGDMLGEFANYLGALQGGQPEARDKLSAQAQQAIKDFRAKAYQELQQQSLARRLKKGDTGGQRYWWRVGLRSNPNYSIEVVGSTEREAIESAIDNDTALERFNPDRDFTARPIRPYEAAPTQGEQQYEIFHVPSGRVTQQFNAQDDSQALRFFDRQISQGNRPYYDVRRVRTTGQSQPVLTAPETDPDANWALVRIQDQQPVQYFIANTRQEAERMIQGSEHIYTVRPVQPRTSAGPIPGSTLDLQRQRAAAAQPEGASNLWWDQPTGTGGFTGTWRVLIDGEEVHRFGGVGNVQADANRIAQQWILDQIRRGLLSPQEGASVEVVPEMV